jgi:hypothetical protein
LFIVEPAIFEVVKVIFIVLSWKFLDLFLCFFRAFNHTY